MQRLEASRIGDNEQLLMSYLIDLNNLGRLLARLSPKEASSNSDDLQQLSRCLHLVQTRLTELLISTPPTDQLGSDFVNIKE